MMGRIARITMFACLAVLLSAFLASSGSQPAAKAQPHISGDRHCKQVGGSIITNFGAVDPNTTLGPATGDLAGAVAATLKAPQPGPIVGGVQTIIFNVQHHWVTASGDNIFFKPAVAETIQIPNSSTLFAVVSYKATIDGGTGKFAGATGELDNIGEADLVRGTAFRYSGEVCFADPE